MPRIFKMSKTAIWNESVSPRHFYSFPVTVEACLRTHSPDPFTQKACPATPGAAALGGELEPCRVTENKMCTEGPSTSSYR